MRGSERGQATVEWSALGLMLALLFATAGVRGGAHRRLGLRRRASCTRSSCAVAGRLRGARLARPRVRRRRRRAGAPLLAERRRTSAAAPRCRSTSAAAARPTARTGPTPRARSTARAPGCPSPPSRAWSTGAPAAGRCTSSTGSTTRRASPARSAACSATAGPAITRMIGRAIRCGSRRVAACPRARRRTAATARAGAPGRGGCACRAAATPVSSRERSTGERSTPASKIALMPLERLKDTARYGFEVSPPWGKDVYRVPESAGS